jgi:hypothetical protein
MSKKSIIKADQMQSTGSEPTPFIDYWNSVDAAMLSVLAIDTSDAGIEPDLIAAAQEEGQTPEEFARWFGEKYGLKTIDE